MGGRYRWHSLLVKVHMKLHVIWAQARNRAIGQNNQLPWHLPEDLQYFKLTTRGCPVVMGRLTYESLPVKPLPGRRNIVISGTEGYAPRGAEKVASLEDALALLQQVPRIFVIGGERVFNQALAQADRVYLTEVDMDVPGADRFAPELPTHFECRTASPWKCSEQALSYRHTVWFRRPAEHEAGH